MPKKILDLAKEYGRQPADLIRALSEIAPKATATTVLDDGQIKQLEALIQVSKKPQDAISANPYQEFNPVTEEEAQAYHYQQRQNKLKELALRRYQETEFQLGLEEELDELIDAYVTSGEIRTEDQDIGLLVIALGERRSQAHLTNPLTQVRQDANGAFHIPKSTRSAILQNVRPTRLIEARQARQAITPSGN